MKITKETIPLIEKALGTELKVIPEDIARIIFFILHEPTGRDMLVFDLADYALLVKDDENFDVRKLPLIRCDIGDKFLCAIAKNMGKCIDIWHKLKAAGLPVRELSF